LPCEKIRTARGKGWIKSLWGGYPEKGKNLPPARKSQRNPAKEGKKRQEKAAGGGNIASQGGGTGFTEKVLKLHLPVEGVRTEEQRGSTQPGGGREIDNQKKINVVNVPEGSGE